MANTDYWLSATGQLGNGSGSSAANAADASTQAKLDAIWAAQMGGHSAASTITFHYLPGLYQTKGHNFVGNIQTFQPGNIHQGSGMGNTTIQLVGSSSATNDGQIFGNDTQLLWVNTWGCYDMTLDANAVNQPKWTGAGGAINCILMGGGQNVTIQRVRFINFGTPTLGSECFPCGMTTNAQSVAQSVDNNLIDHCIFTQPAIGNKDGCSAISISDNPGAGNATITQNNIISFCQFINCFQVSGLPGDFTYFHCAAAPQVNNCLAVNSGILTYFEPGANNTYNGIDISLRTNAVLFTKGALISPLANSTGRFFQMNTHGGISFTGVQIDINGDNIFLQNVDPAQIQILRNYHFLGTVDRTLSVDATPWIRSIQEYWLNSITI